MQYIAQNVMDMAPHCSTLQSQRRQRLNVAGRQRCMPPSDLTCQMFAEQFFQEATTKVGYTYIYINTYMYYDY